MTARLAFSLTSFFGIAAFLSILFSSNGVVLAADEKSLLFDHEVNISQTDGDSKLPRIAVQGSNIYIVWQDNTTGNYDVFFTHSPDGGKSFTPVLSISNNTGTSEQPQIAVQDSNIYIVWQDNTPGNNDIFFTNSSDGGKSFAPALSISNNTGTSEKPQIAIQGNYVYVVWQDNTDGNYDIIFKRTLSKNIKFVERNLSKNNGTSQFPQIAVQGSNVYVVWQDNTPGNYDILLKRSSTNGTGFKTVHLENTPGKSLYPQIRLNGSEVYVVWQDNSPGNYDVYLQRSLSNGTKFGTRNISDNNSTSERPQISITRGETYVAWRDNQQGIYDIFFRHGKKDSADKNQFGPSFVLGSSGKAGFPKLTSGSEFLYGVWNSSSANAAKGVLELYPFMLFSDNSGSNAIPLTRLSSNQVVSDPDVAVSGEDVFVVWTGQNGTGDILFKKISAGTF